MSRDSGFVPIRFHIAGKLLLVAGILGLLLTAVATVTRWFVLPSAVPILSLVAILVSLYLILIVPREGVDLQE